MTIYSIGQQQGSRNNEATKLFGRPVLLVQAKPLPPQLLLSLQATSRRKKATPNAGTSNKGSTQEQSKNSNLSSGSVGRCVAERGHRPTNYLAQ